MAVIRDMNSWETLCWSARKMGLGMAVLRHAFQLNVTCQAAPENGFLHVTEATTGACNVAANTGALWWAPTSGFVWGTENGVVLPHAAGSSHAPKPNPVTDGSMGLSAVLAVLYYECNSGYVWMAPAGEHAKKIKRGMEIWAGSLYSVDCGSPRLNAAR